MGVNTTFFSKKSVASHSDSREIALWWQWRESARKTAHANSIQQQPQPALVFVRSALSNFTKSRTELDQDIFYGSWFYNLIVVSSFPTPKSHFQLPYSFRAKTHCPISLQLPYRINKNINHLAATFTHPSTPCPPQWDCLLLWELLSTKLVSYPAATLLG